MFLLRWLIRLIKAVLIVVVLVLAIPIAGLAYGFWTTNALDATPLAGVAEGAPPTGAGRSGARRNSGLPAAGGIDLLDLSRVGDRLCRARICRRSSRPSRESYFPYWSYIGRFWQDYAMVIRASAGQAIQFRQPSDAGGDRHQPHDRARDPVALRKHDWLDHRMDVGQTGRRRPLSGRRSSRIRGVPRSGALVPIPVCAKAGRAFRGAAGCRRQQRPHI